MPIPHGLGSGLVQEASGTDPSVNDTLSDRDRDHLTGVRNVYSEQKEIIRSLKSRLLHFGVRHQQIVPAERLEAPAKSREPGGTISLRDAFGVELPSRQGDGQLRLAGGV